MLSRITKLVDKLQIKYFAIFVYFNTEDHSSYPVHNAANGALFLIKYFPNVYNAVIVYPPPEL